MVAQQAALERQRSIRRMHFLADHLPNATLLVYPDAGHGSLFQYPDSFAAQAKLFLD